MVLYSKYANGDFRSGKWYCGCNEEANWLTSRTENSKGEKFACCIHWGTDESDKDCGFFLTKADEAKARLEKSSKEAPSAPKTPVSRRTIESMLTPNTGSSSRVKLFGGGGRAGRLSSVNDSPTARRFAHVDSSDDDLASVIIHLLKQEGIGLRSSTESLVRHAIGSHVGKHEAALKNSNDSLAFALQKLDELESDAAAK
ncbi:hypothetical protein BBO_09329 [Beauveria brongniartii RCEF 3172]|uniref:Uncharacterized protein n=1 Tax=Beauveria brongniartii RCEF 3172 TaxID=1081107 RepID=A0A166VWG6_9HYPO|nr:hypothetical protein BBO_09329 [Beauveria brongniartii RCEF 3172]